MKCSAVEPELTFMLTFAWLKKLVWYTVQYSSIGTGARATGAALNILPGAASKLSGSATLLLSVDFNFF
jgi:hypothetical protein